MNVSLLSEHVGMLPIIQKRAWTRGQSGHAVRSLRHIQTIVCTTKLKLSCNLDVRS